MKPEHYLSVDTTPLKKVILFMLAQPDRGHIRPRDLADRVGCSRSTLYVGLEEMREAGWLSWRKGIGRGSANTYRLHPERMFTLKLRGDLIK